MKHYNQSEFMRAYPLSPKKPIVKTIKIFCIPGFWAVSFIFFWGITGSIHFLTSLMTKMHINVMEPKFMVGVIIGVALVLFGGLYWYQLLYFRTYFYTITDKLLIIRKGVLAPREITVPFDRIQDIYLDQDVIDNMFKLYDVHISTATAESTARAHIDGVEKHTAEQLRELILQKMQEARR